MIALPVIHTIALPVKGQHQSCTVYIPDDLYKWKKIFCQPFISKSKRVWPTWKTNNLPCERAILLWSPGKDRKKSCYFLQTQTASKLHLSHHLVLLTSLQVPPIFTSMLNCLHTSPVSPLRSIHFISRFHPFFFFTSMLNCFHTLPVSPFRSTHFTSGSTHFFTPPCSTASTLYLSHHLDLLTSSPGSTHLPCSTTSTLYLSHYLKQKGVASILRFHPLYFYVWLLQNFTSFTT